MRHFFIITNALKDKNLRVTEKIISYIKEKGGTVSGGISVDAEGSHMILRQEVPEDTECILVVGGDGTLIRAARDTVSLGIPLIGVNLGKLGYLCELEENTIAGAIDELFEDRYTVEDRMMLGGYALKRQNATEEQIALNDFVNGEYLYSFKADGIILATPTGSTGYNMSAGGPIVEPRARMLLMTPINSHTLNSRSIVINPDAEVTIELGLRRSEKDEQVEVSFDGDHNVRLEVGDKIVVHKAGASAKILKISKKSFLEILRKKMQAYT